MKGIVVAAFLIAFSMACVAESQKSWYGYITDTHCGTHCQRTTDMKPDKACVRLCVRRGSKYGLWYGDHVYPLEPQAEAAKFAAENVRVNGTMVNGTIQIESIALRGR